MTALPSTVQAPTPAPETLDHCRKLTRPALTEFGLDVGVVR
ncbi:hypothetical protein [Streptomyces sp. NPDC001816]